MHIPVLILLAFGLLSMTQVSHGSSYKRQDINAQTSFINAGGACTPEQREIIEQTLQDALYLAGFALDNEV